MQNRSSKKVPCPCKSLIAIISIFLIPLNSHTVSQGNFQSVQNRSQNQGQPEVINCLNNSSSLGCTASLNLNRTEFQLRIEPPAPEPELEFLLDYPNDENRSHGEFLIAEKSTREVAPGKIHEVSKILNNILQNYDPRIRPEYYGPPVQVSVSLMVKSISSISEVGMEFKLDFYLRQSWEDPRLEFKSQPRVEVISLSSEFTHQLWQPDTFFPNEKKSYIHSATVVNEFIRLSSNGHVLKSTRLTLTSSCPMSLRLFPMDHQICSVEIESYGFTTESIAYIWADGDGNSVVLGPKVDSLPQFRVVGSRERHSWDSTSTGNYSMLVVEFLFVRSLNYYLTQVYIPAGLIVIISWFSLYMGRDAAEGRLALGVTTVLTITTLQLSTSSNSPKISYVKAIDIYLGICFTYVFGALLQSAAIGYMVKKLKEQQVKVDRVEHAQDMEIIKKRCANSMDEKHDKKKKEMQKLKEKLSELKLFERQVEIQSPILNSIPIPSISLQLGDETDNESENMNPEFVSDFDLENQNGFDSREAKEINMTRDVTASTVQIVETEAEAEADPNSDTGNVEADLGADLHEVLTSARNTNNASVEMENGLGPHPLLKKSMKVEIERENLETKKAHISLCDVVSRLVFPTTFISINLVYWTYYLNASKLEDYESWK